MQLVTKTQLVLERCELRNRIFLKRNKEESGINLAAYRINAVGIIVATSQDSHTLILRWCGNTDVGPFRDHR
jgi:hypothetical protein